MFSIFLICTLFLISVDFFNSLSNFQYLLLGGRGVEMGISMMIERESLCYGNKKRCEFFG